MEFFRVIKELSEKQDCQTVMGIDGRLAGHKAVLQKDGILYSTEGFREVVPGMWQQQIRNGLIQTDMGRIFVETLGASKKLILCGGGHVSAATLSIAKMLEFQITVVEDRPEFAHAARVTGADRVICSHFSQALQALETDKDTYVIVMTRGHRHDLECLVSMLKKEYAYLGMMGSRFRVKKIKEQLLAQGFDADKVAGIYAPIGLKIGAATPAEIGVSIMAEIIQKKNEEPRQEAYEKEVSDWLFEAASECLFEKPLDMQTRKKKEQKQAVLAVIIDRRGSAPRRVGTKMLIFADGTAIGTIGGGCMEAEVKSRARHMLSVWQEEQNSSQTEVEKRAGCCGTCMVDLTGRDAEEEGMVCGGTLEIYLEILPYLC